MFIDRDWRHSFLKERWQVQGAAVEVHPGRTNYAELCSQRCKGTGGGKLPDAAKMMFQRIEKYRVCSGESNGKGA